MKNSILFLVVFFFSTFSLIAQERHLKNAKAFIEKGSFDKALDRIANYESSVGTKYESVYVRYLLQAKYPISIVGIDSSITLLKSANDLFLAEVDEKKKNNLCEELQICGNDLLGLIDSVEVKLFELCKVGNVEEQLTWYLKKYPQTKIFNAASKFLHQFAFSEVLKQNTEVAYQNFVTKYPQSEEFKIALDSLESISYQGALQANSVEKYSRFLSQYPKSTKQALLKRKMWDKAFQEAQEIHTKTAYTDFIKRFASSDLVLSAQKAIEKLDWEAALLGNQRALFVLFVNDYPKSSLLKDALLRIEGFDWDLAKKDNTRAAFEKFLDKYPLSTKKEDALASIEKFDWEVAKRENTRESYAAFVDKYAESGNVKQAMSSIEKFDWDEASKDGSLQALQNFLDGYPDGAFAAEAKSMMNGLKLVVPYLTSNRKYKLYDATMEQFVSENVYDNVQVVDNELFIITNLDKKGIVNKFGDNITLATYDCFIPVGKKYFIFQLGSKFGLMDRKGDTVVQPIYDALNSHGDSILITSIKTGKIVKKGIVDLKGKVFIDNKFRDLTVIGNNQLIVSLDKVNYFLANSTATPISASYANFYSDRIVNKSGKSGYLNEKGKLAIPIIYSSLNVQQPGYYVAENAEKKIGLIDSLGQIIIPFDKYSISHVGEGIYALDKSVNANSNKSVIQLFSISKKRIINSVPFEQVGTYKDGLMSVKLSGKFGYVNVDGKIVISAIFDSFSQELQPYDEDFEGDLLRDIYGEDPGDGEPGEQEEDAGDYLDNSCYDNLNENSLDLAPLYPASITDFSEGLAVAIIGEKFGAIDKNGKIVVPISYDFLSPFRNGIAVAITKISDQKCNVSIINKSGQVVIKDHVIYSWLSNDRAIIRNRAGEFFELELNLNTSITPKPIGKDIMYFQRFKDYLKLFVKDAYVYTTPDFVWYADENIDFSSFEAQKSVQAGNSHRFAKEYDEALLEYKKSLSISPKNYGALFGIAETYKDQNSTQYALEYADQALEVANEQEKYNVLVFKFNIYKDRSNWAETINLASQIITQFPDVRYSYYVERGLAYFESRQYSSAIDDFTYSFQGDNTGYYRGLVYNLRGVCYSRLNMIPNAIADFRKATILGAKDREDALSLGIYFNNLGNSLLSIKNKSEALAAYKKAASYGNQDAARTLRSSIFRK